MRVMPRLRNRIEREHVLLLGLAALVALAGCSGTDPGDSTEAETPTAAATTDEIPDDTPADTTPEEGLEDGSERDDGETNVTFRFGQTLEAALQPVENGSVTASGVLANLTTATDRVQTYHVASNVTTTTMTNNVERTQRSRTRSAIDQTRPAVRANQTISASGRTVRQRTYILNGTLYRHSERYVQRYNSEWIKRNLSENFSEQFAQQDELALQRRLLTNGTTTLEGVQRVEGERTYRLRTELDESGYAEAYGLEDRNRSEVDVRMVVVVWVDTETGTIRRSEGKVVTTATSGGQPVTSVVAWDETFDYGDVDITLPDAAETAVAVGN